MSLLTLLTVVHLIIALFLIFFVLLQDSKGGALGFLGGGGNSNTIFGTGGAVSFLVKATRWTAILFAASCVGLAYLSTHSGSSVTDQFIPSAPVESQEEAPPQENPGTKPKETPSSPKKAPPPK